MILQAFPIFTESHILRKEMLETLSDYGILYHQYFYKGYANGIVTGCELTTTKEAIIVNPGVLCCQEKLYLIKEPMSVEYEATDVTSIVKFQFSDEIVTENFLSREIELLITSEEKMLKGDMELCRFKLQRGAKLRYEYQDFDDRNTEYDTLNTIYAPYAARERATISLHIVQAFAKEMLKNEKLSEFDSMFCIQVLNQTQAMGKEALNAYIQQRLQSKMKADTNFDIYKNLSLILGETKHGRDSTVSKQKRNQWKIKID